MKTRVGMHYVTGPADRDYVDGDPAFNLHTVVADESPVKDCVTVKNAAGQEFPVPAALIDQIAAR